MEAFARPSKESAAHPAAKFSRVLGTSGNVGGGRTISHPECTSVLVFPEFFVGIVSGEGVTPVRRPKPFFQLDVVGEAVPIEVGFAASEKVDIVRCDKGLDF